MKKNYKSYPENLMKKYKYQFTVFTPVYNRKHTIHRVWNSLNAQTYRDFEWIIVDVPNSPVRRGRRGCLTSIFNEANPRNPARMKIRMAFFAAMRPSS